MNKLTNETVVIKKEIVARLVIAQSVSKTNKNVSGVVLGSY